VGVPVVATGLVVGSAVPAAHGPDLPAMTAPGTVLVTVIGIAGYGVALFAQLRHPTVIVVFGAFLAHFPGPGILGAAVTTTRSAGAER
jgi:hypothetical protein